MVVASGIFDGTAVGGDAGESEIDGGVLRSALPEGEEVGFGFVETAGIVAVAQGAGQAELVLGVGGIAGEGGAESGDGVVVAVGAGLGEALRVELAAAGLLIGGEAGDEMADRGEGDGGSDVRMRSMRGAERGNEFGERPRHVSYHDIILRGWKAAGVEPQKWAGEPPVQVRYFVCRDCRRMNREYHKGYSQELNRDMEALVFGHAGTPLLVFPTSMGKFFEYEDRGMIGVLAPKIERGDLQVFCPDGVDTESWYNKGVHPKVRVLRHLQYERYILHELVPFIRWKNQTPRLAVTGCSFGAYHAVNFAFKHPDVVTHCVSMSGAFDIHQFLDGYYDDDCYFNCPPDYLPNQNDDWFLSRYRQMKIVLGSADWDMCLDQNVKLSAILNGKAVPHWLDIYGDNSKHDWPLWQRMAGKYF